MATVRIARSTTKTDAGARTVPLDSRAAAVLRRHFLATGRPGGGSPVFADDQGRPLTRSGRVRFGLDRVARAARVGRRVDVEQPAAAPAKGRKRKRPAPALSAHVLRHAHATWLAQAGVPPAAAAARLGHADGGALFLRVYAHPNATDGAAALAALEDLRRRQAAG